MSGDTPVCLDHESIPIVLLLPRRVMLAAVADDEDVRPENVMAGAQPTNSGTFITRSTVMVLTAHGFSEDWITRVLVSTVGKVMTIGLFWSVASGVTEIAGLVTYAACSARIAAVRPSS